MEEQQSTEETIFIRRTQAARLAQVDPRTISRWAEGGKVRYKRDEEGRLLIDKSSIDIVEPTELEHVGSNEDRLVERASLLLSQAHTHIEKKEAQIERLVSFVTNLQTGRDKHTLDALDRMAKENAALHREADKLRRDYAKLEMEAAGDAFETDSHERNEARKDRLVGSVVAAVTEKLGVGDKAKEVVDAIQEATKDD